MTAPRWLPELVLVLVVGAFFACVGYVVGTFLVGMLP